MKNKFAVLLPVMFFTAFLLTLNPLSREGVKGITFPKDGKKEILRESGGNFYNGEGDNNIYNTKGGNLKLPFYA